MTDAGPTPSGFRHEGDDLLRESARWRLVESRHTDPDGEGFTREVVRHPGAVAVVPLHDDGTVTLVRQYRAALHVDLLEIPAGLRDVEGEPLERTAARELAEEVGLQAAQLVHLADFVNSAGFTDERTTVFLGLGLSDAALDRQGLEEQHMAIERVHLDDVAALVATGELIDAKTVIGLLLTVERVRQHGLGG